MTNPIKYLIKLGLNLTALILVLAINTGCSVITETECRYADFAEIGYADASKGKLRAHFNKYQEKCLTYDIDLSDEIVMYDFGRERGLFNYCNKVHYSSQCDRGGSDLKVKSHQHIGAEMLRLGTKIPKIATSLSR